MFYCRIKQYHPSVIKFRFPFNFDSFLTKAVIIIINESSVIQTQIKTCLSETLVNICLLHFLLRMAWNKKVLCRHCFPALL
jgi:hypothetical protein